MSVGLPPSGIFRSLLGEGRPTLGAPLLLINVYELELGCFALLCRIHHQRMHYILIHWLLYCLSPFNLNLTLGEQEHVSFTKFTGAPQRAKLKCVSTGSSSYTDSFLSILTAPTLDQALITTLPDNCQISWPVFLLLTLASSKHTAAGLPSLIWAPWVILTHSPAQDSPDTISQTQESSLLPLGTGLIISKSGFKPSSATWTSKPTLLIPQFTLW